MSRTSFDGYPALDQPEFFPGLGCLQDQEEPGSRRLKHLTPRNGQGRTISLETYLPSDTSCRIHAGEQEAEEELPF